MYEQSHRVVAAIAGLLIAGLWLMIRRREDLVWARRLTVAAAFQYLAQVLLGGLVILTLDPPWVAVLHVALANAVFASLILVSITTSGWWNQIDRAGPGGGGVTSGQRRAAGAVIILALLQILLGAATRHPPAGETGSAVTFLGHMVNAIVMLVFVIRLPRAIAKTTTALPARGLARLVLTLVIIQWVVAIPLFIISPEPDAAWPPPNGFQALHATHVAIAALILAFAAGVYATLGRLHRLSGS